ncbi:hypothetical protein GCM10011357_28230 [Lacimicrobium alkaliphilum]|uniref:DUF3298 domain-containing protein n=1 Tax=Lacimicrobium alkaliphilum TaxID=1526571 RepID=A0ABQ1RJ23_9ALTE|nr:hypothetical protein GCM10011357_28230 [Lacimicrobium alkaliphilum]
MGVFYKDATTELQRICERKPARQNCRINDLDPALFQQSLQQTALFPMVIADEAGADYELLITSLSYREKRNKMQARVTLAWRGLPLRNYEYIISRTGKRDDAAFAGELVSQFLQDAIKQKAFSPGFLAHNLKSEDYEDDLKAPEQVSNFSLSERRIYNDPLEGSMLTYRDPSFSNDKIEVSVYPIPTSDIEDTHAILEEETEKLRDNLTDFATDLNLPPLHMTDDIRLSWNMMDKEFNGYYLDAKIEKDGLEPFYASYFFFVQEDKIVKFTTTFPSRFALDFVKQALPRLSVPGESPFISNLRRL